MILNVNPQLSQWDVNRFVEVSDTDATHIHFANPGDSKAPIIEIVDDAAQIPNYLLQTGKPVVAYAVLDGVTVGSKTFPVRKRERPENYVYEDDQRNYIYELIANAEAAAQGANEAAAWANEAADRASEYAGDVEALQNELTDLRTDYEGNKYESASEAVRSADIALNTRIQEVSELAHANAVGISVLQETVENIDPGGGGGLTDEEFSQKAADIIYDEQANGGGPFLEALDTEAWSVSESCMEDFGLLSYSEDEGGRVRNVPTYEELPQKMADAIQAEWDDGSGHLLDTLDMVAWSAGYSATECYLQEYGFTDVDEEGMPIRNVPTYREVEEQIGNIETAIDSILAIQNQLIGGDNV